MRRLWCEPFDRIPVKLSALPCIVRRLEIVDPALSSLLRGAERLPYVRVEA